VDETQVFTSTQPSSSNGNGYINGGERALPSTDIPGEGDSGSGQSTQEPLQESRVLDIADPPTDPSMADNAVQEAAEKVATTLTQTDTDDQISISPQEGNAGPTPLEQLAVELDLS